MNARTPQAANSEPAGSIGLLLDELEMPDTAAFAVFADQLEARLSELEARFCDYVTRDSFAASISR